MEKLNLLLVGGMGSIGQHLSKNLPKTCSLLIMDKKKLKKNPNNYIQCELGDIENLKNVVNNVPNNLIVVYLAGNLSNSFSNDDASKSIQDNLVGLSNFITTFYSKIQHFIYISSISVYGIPNYIPIDENHTTEPFSFYGCMKRCGEILSSTLCNSFQIPLSIVRSTQVYGINSASNSLPHILVNHLKNKKNLSINCNPHLQRDYIHISDFCRFMNKLLLKPTSGTFNLGTGIGITILDLFEISYKLQNKKFELNEIIDIDSKYSFSQVLDITKIKQEFNFQPNQNIKNWLKNQLDDSKN